MEQLQQKRDDLAAELKAIDREIAALDDSRDTARTRTGRRPGRPTGRRTQRGRKGPSLVEALQSALAGKTLSVSEAADAAVSAGYRTKSKNLRTMVNQALLKHTDKFKKVARGQYAAR